MTWRKMARLRKVADLARVSRTWLPSRPQNAAILPIKLLRPILSSTYFLIDLQSGGLQFYR